MHATDQSATTSNQGYEGQSNQRRNWLEDSYRYLFKPYGQLDYFILQCSVDVAVRTSIVSQLLAGHVTRVNDGSQAPFIGSRRTIVWPSVHLESADVESCALSSDEPPAEEYRPQCPSPSASQVPVLPPRRALSPSPTRVGAVTEPALPLD